MTTPSFDFQAFYYPQILDSLNKFKELNVPELTDESEFEPLNILLKAFALVGHLNSVELDLVANESFIRFSQLPETTRELLRNIGYELVPYLPSKALMVAQLARNVTTDNTKIIPKNSGFSTSFEGQENVNFETLQDFNCNNTNRFLKIYWSETGDTVNGNIMNYGENVFTDATKFLTQGYIYFCHENVTCDTFKIFADNESTYFSLQYVDNYFRKTSPDSISVESSRLKFEVTSLVGTYNVGGLTIKISLNNVSRDTTIFFENGRNYILTDYLEQSEISTNLNDYILSSYWLPFEIISDTSNNLSQDGTIVTKLPINKNSNHSKTQIQFGSNIFTGYWIRIKYNAVSTITSDLGTKASIGFSMEKKYYPFEVFQGQTRFEEVIGSSTGEVNQEFEVTQSNFILDSETIKIDNEIWSRVPNFLNREQNDKIYKIIMTSNNRAVVKFGDGINGKIPSGGSDIICTYRYGANINGNVASSTITTDRNGLAYLSNILNPRDAIGWQQAEDSSSLLLEKAKEKALSSLNFNINQTLCSVKDVEYYTTNLYKKDSVQIFNRCNVVTRDRVFEITVAGQIEASNLIEYQNHLNEDKLVANHMAEVYAYQPYLIDLEFEVTGDVDLELLRNYLYQNFDVNYVKDGQFVWNFGDVVARSKIIHQIFLFSDKIKNVNLIKPFDDIYLTNRQMIKLNDLTILKLT